jgi:hypothetical protein
MRTSSAKAKGRRLQDWVKSQIVKRHKLDPETCHTAVMGQSGADVWLEKKVRSLFPYSIECKNQEKYKGIYDTLEQAKSHSTLEPLVVIKMNHKKPIVVLDAEAFFELQQNNKKGK